MAHVLRLESREQRLDVLPRVLQLFGAHDVPDYGCLLAEFQGTDPRWLRVVDVAAREHPDEVAKGADSNFGEFGCGWTRQELEFGQGG